MFQKMIVMGQLGADPEMRYTPEGSPVTNFSVAVQEGKEPSVSGLWPGGSWPRYAINISARGSQC